MDKKILDYLYHYFGKDNLLDLLDESSRRYKISRYNDNWKYNKPNDGDPYSGGIMWDLYKLGSSIGFSRKNDYISDTEADALNSLLNKENSMFIPYSELPNHYRDIYDRVFNLDQGPRDDFTNDFLDRYGSDDDELVDLNNVQKVDLDYILDNDYKFGGKQVDPVTGETLFNRGDTITREALDKLRDSGIEKFLHKAKPWSSTDIVKKQKVKNILDKISAERSKSPWSNPDDTFYDYFSDDNNFDYYDMVKEYSDVFPNGLGDFDFYDYKDKLDSQRNIADALSDIKY